MRIITVIICHLEHKEGPPDRFVLEMKETDLHPADGDTLVATEEPLVKLYFEGGTQWGCNNSGLTPHQTIVRYAKNYTSFGLHNPDDLSVEEVKAAFKKDGWKVLSVEQAQKKYYIR